MKSYTLSLDIGTGSVGWAVLDDQYQIMNKKSQIKGGPKKRKNLWGATLFETAETAAKTRMFRSTRRRYNRQKYRLDYLNLLFEEEILKIDDGFFIRLSESSHSPNDSQRVYHGQYLFQDKLYKDRDYYKKYPTIYHLRKELVDNPEKADIRLIYLACHHILKHRGNFLYENEEFHFNNQDISQTGSYLLQKNLLDFQAIVSGDYAVPSEKYDSFTDILAAKQSATRKNEELQELLFNKKDKKITELFKLVFGLKANIASMFGLELKKNERELNLGAEDVEEQLLVLESLLDDELTDLIYSLQKTYQRLQLERILTLSKNDPSEAKLSTTMTERYHIHEKQLKELKQLVLTEYGYDTYCRIFKKKHENYSCSDDNYACYIEGKLGDKHEKTSRENFYKFLKGKHGLNITETSTQNPRLKSILQEIEADTYLVKQRIRENGAIPYQVHEHELKLILENQGAHYPFLKNIKEKLVALLTFRIPYYVGPLTDSPEMSSFAWMVKKKAEPVTPWTFEEVVDRAASAERFIERMRNFDTYIPTEEVLPKASILYQKFEVLNELNKIKVNEKPISIEVKKRIFNDLFLTRKKVSLKELEKYLVENCIAEKGKIRITGTQKEDAFASSMSTFIDFKNILGDEVVIDEQNAPQLEEIIKWMTLFEDKKILKEKLLEVPQLDLNQITQLLKKRYRGWGRLSRKLLDGLLTQQEGNQYAQSTLIDLMWHQNRNFMELIHDDKLDFKQKLDELMVGSIKENIREEVDNLAGSPALKKGIRTSIEIVEEITKILKTPPKNIVIEMAREVGIKKRTVDRQKKLTEAYNKIKTITSEYNDSLMKELKTVTKEELQSEIVYLYFKQNGKCMYSGKPLGSLEEIQKKIVSQSLEIDHILPQAYIKDDSLDNKALVYRDENQRKSDSLLLEENIINKNRLRWQYLKEADLISGKTFFNLIRREVNEQTQQQFINRQLVETRQITKHVAHLLNSTYPETEVILLKSALVSEFRRKYDFPKLRSINDYHHAQDAYLNGVVAQFILRKYHSLKSEFILGDYQKNVKKQGNTKKLQGSFFISRFSTKQIDQETGEVIWDPTVDFVKIRKNYQYRQCNIVQKTSRNTGEFYNQTKYRKDASFKKMIPFKKELPTELYGGYAGVNSMYTVAIEYREGKVLKKKLVEMPIYLWHDGLTETEIKDYLQTKNPEMLDISLLNSKILNNQRLILDGNLYYLKSYQTLRTANQVVYPIEVIKALKAIFVAKEQTQELVEQSVYVYKQVSQEIGKQIPTYHSISSKLLEKVQQFEDLSFSDKILILQRITTMGTSGGESADLKLLGMASRIGRINNSKGYSFKSLCLVHQSITGFYEEWENL